MKNILMVLAIFLITTTNATAFGYKAEINTQNDRFENTGKILADQITMGGAANQVVAQRARSPQLDAVLSYRSSGNVYKNSGEIKGSQKTVGGASSQVVAQEAY